MKRSELFFSAILLPLDYTALVFAGFLAYQIRYLQYIKEIRPIIFDLPFTDYFILVIIFSFIWICIFALQGLYSVRGARRQIDEIGKIFVACSAGIAVVMATMFFTRYLFDSRFILLATWVLSIIIVAMERIITRSIQRKLYQKGIGIHRVILIGDGDASQVLSNEFEAHKRLGYRVVKKFPVFTPDVKNTLIDMAKNNLFDEIILTNPDISRNTSLEILEFTNTWHVDYKYVADILGTKVSNFEVHTYADIPIVEIKKTPLDGWGKILKRFFDIIFSVIFIAIFFPIMALSAIAIKLDSNGQVFFRYKRVGEKGRIIDFLKFRTMVKDAHKLKYDNNFVAQNINLREGTPMIKFANDPRITRIGKFLRRYSIDELPQLFLVFFGKMSMVGPRPHEIEEVARYDNIQKRVLNIKPGITGLAQVSGRSDLDFNEEISLDIFYMENWSLKMDIQIIFKTPGAILNKRKAL